MKRQDELNEAWCKYMGKCSTEILHALAFALRWCDEHPHWISVEDELPKEDGTYLFYNAETQGVYVSYFWADLTLNENISHWMRIRKPSGDKTSPVEKGGDQ